MVDDLGTVYEVFIHFDFDDYKPDRLDDLRKSGNKGEFHIYKMVPQGTFSYFYSYIGKAFIDPEMPQAFIDIDLKMNIKEKLKVGNAFNSYDCRVEDISNLESVNTINSLSLK